MESITNVVDLFVDLGTMMVSLLTSTGDRVLDPGRMPGSDTSDLAKTLVRLPRKLLGVPPGSDAWNTTIQFKKGVKLSNDTDANDFSASQGW